MKDRIPLHAGRVQLVPVSGNLYDMTMADDPTEAGTPLNKANLLSDAAAQAVWRDPATRPSDPVPSEAFIKLGGKSVLLADYTATADIRRTTPITFNLIDDVENYDGFEVWFSAQGLDTSPAPTTFIDIGSAQDENARIATMSNVPTTAMTSGYAKSFFLQNDASGHIILNTAGGSAATGSSKLTGTAVTWGVTSTAGRVIAGSRVIIIGYKA